MKQANKQKKILIIGSIIVIIPLLLTGWYFYTGSFFGWSPFKKADQMSTIDYQKPTDEQKQAGEKIKENSLNQKESETPPSNGSQTKKEVEITITAANQTDSLLQVRSLLTTLDASGTCTLQLSSLHHATITKTSTAQAFASSSSCQGFNIPLTELATGSWQLHLAYESATVTGHTTKTIEIH